VVEFSVIGPLGPPMVAVIIGVSKPVTVTVTFVPTAPEAGDTLTVGAPIMVRVAVALSVGALPEAVSVRFTVYDPAATFGTANDIVPTPVMLVGNAPALVTVALEIVVVVPTCVIPWKIIIVPDRACKAPVVPLKIGVKPDPLTVIAVAAAAGA